MPGKLVNSSALGRQTTAVVIPCFRVRKQIHGVAVAAARFADSVYVVDDCCPEGTADFVESQKIGRNITIVRNPQNLGVGGATLAGYRRALADGHEVIVKMDGDGQMDPSQLPYIVAPILRGEADYTKGNRFFNIQDVKSMPRSRLFGNAALSFLTKMASGYWTIFDPTNGFTAIHARVLERLPLDRISNRFFFESDMLFRLGTLRAHVVDVPMAAFYGEEQSNIRPSRLILPFLLKNIRNALKRIFYNYFLRDFSVASLNLALAIVTGAIGMVLGALFWLRSFHSGIPATSGEVMLAGLPLIIAMQLILAFFAYDVEFTPKRPIHQMLPPLASRRGNTTLGPRAEK